MANPFKKTKTTRALFFMMADVMVIALSLWLAFWLRFDGHIPAQYHGILEHLVILGVLVIIPVFFLRKLYSFSWSYVSSDELISLFLSTVGAFLIIALAIFISNLFPRFTNFPRSTLVVWCLLVFVFSGLLRFSKRIWIHATGLKETGNKDRTLIVGAGDAGEQILRNMLHQKNSPYLPVGFADDNNLKQGITIHGIKVLGKISDIPTIIKEHDIVQMIVAFPSANQKVIRSAVDLGRQAGLRKIKIAPSLHEIMRGQVSLKNLKDIDVEDLLGREPIELDKKELEQFISGRDVLITGAAGSIGSELCRQVAGFNPSSLLLLDQDETGIFTITKELNREFPDVALQSLIADVTDAQRVDAIFAAYRPAIVFHAAAYKHVPLMEQNVSEAVKNNVFGTRHVAQACVSHGAEKFIFISTDKAINPTSVMGTTKRVGEMICQALSQQEKTKFISVRFGNVLNSRGSVIPIFKEQIRRGGPVEVTHADMQRYFMLISEACLLVISAAAMGQGGEVFVLDMGKPVKIIDLAKEMIRLSGFTPDEDIPIVFTGMRPGEKLFEEIMTADEGIGATKNKKIFTAKLSVISPAEFLSALDSLQIAATRGQAEEIKTALAKLVPTYTGA